MNKIALLLLAALPCEVFAFPKVGDQATYDIRDYDTPGTAVLELTEYDATTDEFKVKSTIQLEGQQPDIDTYKLSSSELQSEATVDAILTACVQTGGALETLRIARLDIRTCKIPDGNGGYTNMGKVPFGHVRFYEVNSDGSVTSMHLTSYKFGP